MGSPRPLTKKQIVDLIARGESLAGLDLRGNDLSGVCFDGAELAEPHPFNLPFSQRSQP